MRYRLTQRDKEYREYRKQCNKTANLYNRLERDHQKKIVKGFKHHPKCFYSYIRGNTKTRAEVPNLEKPNGEKTESDKEIADTLYEFFGDTPHFQNSLRMDDE